jgi:hypothetical protein
MQGRWQYRWHKHGESINQVLPTRRGLERRQGAVSYGTERAFVFLLIFSLSLCLSLSLSLSLFKLHLRGLAKRVRCGTDGS